MGEGKTFARSIENLQAESFFEPADFYTYTGLGQTNILPGLCETARSGNLLKTTQHVYVKIYRYHELHDIWS